MGLKDEEDIEGHDKYIEDMWLNTVNCGDHVYVLGDMILANREESLKILKKLKKNGCFIHFIPGNHDGSLVNLEGVFTSKSLIKVADFKKTSFPFLEEDFTCVMCHYPMKSWSRKCQGSVNLFGHVHNNSPWIDQETDDLCLNVGLDTPFANYHLISLEQIYGWYKNKLNGMSPEEYIEMVTNNNPTFIR